MQVCARVRVQAFAPIMQPFEVKGPFASCMITAFLVLSLLMPSTSGSSEQLMKTGLGGNYDLILSPHDPSHPSSVVAASHRLHKDTDKQPEIDQLAQTDADQQPQTDANQQPALFLEQTRTCSTSTAGSDVGQAPQDNGFSEQQHDQTAGVLKDGHGEKEPQQASRAPQDESPASEEGKEAKVRGQKNLMKLRAAVKAVPDPASCNSLQHGPRLFNPSGSMTPLIPKHTCDVFAHACAYSPSFLTPGH
jgi:hypothetical protein